MKKVNLIKMLVNITEIFIIRLFVDVSFFVKLYLK
jgi:hypothetical protein